MPIDGLAGLMISLLIRVVVKFIVDFAGVSGEQQAASVARINLQGSKRHGITHIISNSSLCSP